MAENIVEKAHCPHCGADLCTERGIYLFLQTPDEGHAITHLAKRLGDYTVSLNKNDDVPQGTELVIKCPRCLAPLNELNHCVLSKVKIEGDPHEDYVLKFLSKMGEHGTILADEHGEIIRQWVGFPEHEEQPMNVESASHG
jgi:hypothetical protein